MVAKALLIGSGADVASGSEVLLDAGWRAAFGAAALVSVIAVIAPTIENWRADLVSAPAPRANWEPETELEVTRTEYVVPVDVAVLSVGRQVERATPTFEPEEIPPQSAPQPQSDANASFRTDAISLALPHEQSVQGLPAQPYQLVETSTEDQLRDAAANFVREWQPPEASSAEISLFVASDDTALAWSLSESSVNHGAISYQEDRVEVGDLAVGISMSVDSAQVALAYVERDFSTPYFGSHEDNFAGVVFTLEH